VAAVSDRLQLRRLVISYAAKDIKLGESIAINGVCLTVVDRAAETVSFDVIAETLDKTNLGQLRVGDMVHIERAMRIGDRLDGHFVQGHVDGTARLLEKTERGEDWRLRIEIPPALAKFFAPKGSICVDGVSLTIADLSTDWFEVALIPATLAITQLGGRKTGYAFNLECDMIGKSVVRYLELYRR
jgi:riboflavin synthase